MKKSFRNSLLLLVAVLLVSVLAACGGGNKDAEDGDKITLRWAHQWGEEHFWNGIGKDLKEEFPDINFVIQEAGTDYPEEIERLIAAKNSPDIVSLGLATHIPFLNDYGLTYNLDDLIEETGFDLDRLEPSIIQYARNQDPNLENGLYFIPNARPTWSLHYNKDVFDTLGVEYPEDGMTWEEVVELAKDLTREVNGIQYRGLDLDVPYDAYTQFSQTSIDPETYEVLIDKSEAYRRHLELVKDVVDIPGNYPEANPEEMFHHWGAKFLEGDIAMLPFATNWHWLEGEDHIDIATYPVWEGYEGINPVPNSGAWAITEPSEHKKEALEVIEYLLSDEVQLEASKQGGKGGAEGGASILVNEEVNAAFGQDNPALDGKNVASLFKNEYATGPDKTSGYGDGVLWTAPIDFIESGKDINEFLRILQEQAEENVREQIETK